MNSEISCKFGINLIIIRKEVDMLKHELMQGMDFLQEQQELMISAKENENFITQFALKAFAILSFFIPFQSLIDTMKVFAYHRHILSC